MWLKEIVRVFSPTKKIVRCTAHAVESYIYGSAYGSANKLTSKKLYHIGDSVYRLLTTSTVRNRVKPVHQKT